MRFSLHTTTSRRHVWLTLAACMTLMAGYFLLLAGRAQAVPQAIVTSVSHIAITARATAPLGQGSTSAGPPRCTPIPFGSPAQLQLSNTPNGLSAQADAPVHYLIYGNTASDLRAQIEHCAPGAAGSTSAEFTGQTSYSLNWQYTAVNNDGSCNITDAKVGLHTSIAVPYWQPTTSANPGLAQRWQHFDSGLLAHEQGHVAIDQAYAVKLLNDLNSLGGVPCGEIDGKVNSIATTNANQLDQANSTYDASTNHGASQGAVLPAY